MTKQTSVNCHAGLDPASRRQRPKSQVQQVRQHFAQEIRTASTVGGFRILTPVFYILPTIKSASATCGDFLRALRAKKLVYIRVHSWFKKIYEIRVIRGYKKMTNKPIFMLKQYDVSHLPTTNCLKLKAKSYNKNKAISNPFD